MLQRGLQPIETSRVSATLLDASVTPCGFEDIDAVAFMRVIEFLRGGGVLSTTPVRHGSMRHFVFSWEVEMLGDMIKLEKFDHPVQFSACASTTADRYNCTGRDWFLTFVWDRSAGSRNFISALQSWGRIDQLWITHYENFLRDWGIIRMFQPDNP